jgi:diguanylate cyclase (GGDEF)-like protein
LLLDKIEEGRPKPTLLLVDDKPSNLRTLTSLLQGPYALRVTNNGSDALTLALEQPIDLVLLDVEMPEMDGHEVCRRLKADPRTQHIPIIFVTSRSDESDELAGLALGAVDYITKPYNPGIVKARVNAHIELKRYRDLLQQHSYVDGLTGIANRRRFDQFLLASWHECANNQAPIGIILADIDHFKKFNDRYGHISGDHCLRQIATALNDTCRRRSDLVARYGGEEFVFVLPHTDAIATRAIAEACRKAVETLAIPHADNLGETVTLSLGFAVSTAQHDDLPDHLIKKADQALYRAKDAGRNRVEST